MAGAERLPLREWPILAPRVRGIRPDWRRSFHRRLWSSISTKQWPLLLGGLQLPTLSDRRDEKRIPLANRDASSRTFLNYSTRTRIASERFPACASNEERRLRDFNRVRFFAGKRPPRRLNGSLAERAIRERRGVVIFLELLRFQSDVIYLCGTRRS